MPLFVRPLICAGNAPGDASAASRRSSITPTRAVDGFFGKETGELDVTKMEFLGEPIAKLAKKYRLGNSIDRQMQWKQAARVTATT